MGIAFAFQLSALAAAMLLCLMSIATSRKHRAKHRRLMGAAGALIALSIGGLAAGLLLDASDDLRSEPLRALVPVGTLLLCVLPIWRALQAKRRRDVSARDRRSTTRPHVIGPPTSRT